MTLIMDSSYNYDRMSNRQLVVPRNAAAQDSCHHREWAWEHTEMAVPSGLPMTG